METLIFSGRALSIVSTVGTDFIIKTLTSTTASIASILTHLTYYDQPGVQGIIDELNKIDLEHMVSVIEELVKENNIEGIKESVKKALLGVNKILENIHNELNSIKEAIDYHQTKYFANYRSFDCKTSINKIKKHKEILDQRYNILIDLLKIYHKI